MNSNELKNIIENARIAGYDEFLDYLSLDKYKKLELDL